MISNPLVRFARSYADDASYGMDEVNPSLPPSPPLRVAIQILFMVNTTRRCTVTDVFHEFIIRARAISSLVYGVAHYNGLRPDNP